jgi:hypothetical protein
MRLPSARGDPLSSKQMMNPDLRTWLNACDTSESPTPSRRSVKLRPFRWCIRSTRTVSPSGDNQQRYVDSNTGKQLRPTVAVSLARP